MALSLCQSGFHHKPNAWLAACCGNHLLSDWRHQSCWCTHGLPVLPDRIAACTKRSTVHNKYSKLSKRTTRLCQHGQKKHNNRSILIFVLVRACSEITNNPDDNFKSQTEVIFLSLRGWSPCKGLPLLSDPELLKLPSSCWNLLLIHHFQHWLTKMQHTESFFFFFFYSNCTVSTF